MKKEKLKRLKALLLAGTICLTLNGCKKDKDEVKEVAVFFIEGKALIYEGNYRVHINNHRTDINNGLKYLLEFTSGVEAVETKSIEDAYELAEAVVGEENIVYIDYIGEDMQVNKDKTLTR